jgi:hypothetical protein
MNIVCHNGNKLKVQSVNIFIRMRVIVVYVGDQMKSLCTFCGRIAEFYSVKAGRARHTRARTHTRNLYFMFTGYFTLLYDL